VDPEINTHINSQVILKQGTKNINWRKRLLVQQIVLRKLAFTCRRRKLDPRLSPCTKINSKWIKDLDARPGNLKLLEENIGKHFKILAQAKIF
jgi:hypothetical protein